MSIIKSNRKVLMTLVLTSCLYQIIECRIFTRCQLTKELLKHQYERTFLSNWVCLAEQESKKNTSLVTSKSNGSFNYGIFQINSRKYCKNGRKGGFCNVACEALIDDDITDDCECARKIFTTEGFKSWPGWEHRCKNGRLPDIEKCPEFMASARISPMREASPNFGRSYRRLLSG